MDRSLQYQSGHSASLPSHASMRGMITERVRTTAHSPSASPRKAQSLRLRSSALWGASLRSSPGPRRRSNSTPPSPGQSTHRSNNTIRGRRSSPRFTHYPRAPQPLRRPSDVCTVCQSASHAPPTTVLDAASAGIAHFAALLHDRDGVAATVPPDASAALSQALALLEVSCSIWTEEPGVDDAPSGFSASRLHELLLLLGSDHRDSGRPGRSGAFNYVRLEEDSLAFQAAWECLQSLQGQEQQQVIEEAGCICGAAGKRTLRLHVLLLPPWPHGPDNTGGACPGLLLAAERSVADAGDSARLRSAIVSQLLFSAASALSTRLHGRRRRGAACWQALRSVRRQARQVATATHPTQVVASLLRACTGLGAPYAQALHCWVVACDGDEAVRVYARPDCENEAPPGALWAPQVREIASGATALPAGVLREVRQFHISTFKAMSSNFLFPHIFFILSLFARILIVYCIAQSDGNVYLLAGASPSISPCS
jgi:hypothetical protein